jgi:hypothetical protein
MSCSQGSAVHVHPAQHSVLCCSDPQRRNGGVCAAPRGRICLQKWVVLGWDAEVLLMLLCPGVGQGKGTQEEEEEAWSMETGAWCNLQVRRLLASRKFTW